MCTRALALAAVLLVPAVALGGDEGPPTPLYGRTPADESPTAFACTTENLLKSDDCTFESEAQPSADPQKQAAQNVKLAAALSTRACTKVARVGAEPKPDKELMSVCEKDFKDAAESCATDGSLPLFDAQGRFAKTARGCYGAMGEVLRRVKLMAAVSAPCCRCLAKASCGGGEQCHRDLTLATPKVPACAAASCESACSPFLPRNHADDDLPPDPLLEQQQKMQKQQKQLKPTPAIKTL